MQYQRESYAILIQYLKREPTGPAPRLLEWRACAGTNRYPIELCAGLTVRSTGARYTIESDGETVLVMRKSKWRETFMTGLGLCFLTSTSRTVFGRGPGVDDCPVQLQSAFSDLCDPLPFPLRYHDGRWWYHTSRGCFSEMQNVREAYIAQKQIALGRARQLFDSPPEPIPVGEMGVTYGMSPMSNAEYELQVLAMLPGAVTYDEHQSLVPYAMLESGAYKAAKCENFVLTAAPNKFELGPCGFSLPN